MKAPLRHRFFGFLVSSSAATLALTVASFGGPGGNGGGSGYYNAGNDANGNYGTPIYPYRHFDEYKMVGEVVRWSYTVEAPPPAPNPEKSAVAPVGGPSNTPSDTPIGAPSDSPSLGPVNSPIPFGSPVGSPSDTPSNGPSGAVDIGLNPIPNKVLPAPSPDTRLAPGAAPSGVAPVAVASGAAPDGAIIPDGVVPSGGPVIVGPDGKDNACLTAVKQYFSDSKNPGVQRFLELQAKLTIERLAWAHLTANLDPKNKDRATAETRKSFEMTIMKLILEREQTDDEAFKAARSQYDRHKLTRAELARVAPLVSSIMKKQYGDDSPFVLGASDLKLLSFVSEGESSHHMKDEWKARGGYTPSYIANFARLVNTGLEKDEQGRPQANLGSANMAAAKKKLENYIQQLQREMKKIVETIVNDAGLKAACSEEQRAPLCGGDVQAGKGQSLESLMQNCQDMIAAMFAGATDQQATDKYRAVRYGRVWARTFLAPKPTTKGPWNQLGHPLDP